MLTVQELKALPKVELHCHLDGSLSLKAIRKLAQMAAVELPASDQALRELVSVPDDIEDLLDYLKRFDVILPLLQTAEALELAAYDVIEQCAAENMRYIEVRFAPDFSTEKCLSVSKAIAAVIKGLHQAQADFGVESGLLVCAMRQYSNQRSQMMFKAAQPFLGQGLVGGDFAGDEADFPTEVIEPAIKTAQQLGIPMTLHAGESHCAHNVMAALALGIRRFGHGVALGGHVDFQKQVSEADGVLEMCLTSNLQTKAVKDLASYPVAELLANQVKITINTDNRTVSNTNLTKEYDLWQRHFGITKSQFLEFNLNAINAAFCSATIRQQVIQDLQKGYAEN